ncbi:hypothetical protein SJ900_05915 [Enterococcus faecium]
MFLTIFCSGTSLSVSASEILDIDNGSQNLETNTEVKIIQKNLSLHKNENGISMVTLTDENKLLNELKNVNSSLSILDVQITIDAFKKKKGYL